ncbi:hypothetical protein PoB_003212400 [Plakobranchus ocellatus]|uniref:Peptidase S1 domain-containing protein n=1 Tax=Plakobranchus ocellatus TaxID=259542 RepID=A0AAV4AGR2_9GAST|nr:hypothetical protein PoB_003212400 [Plakobranchus ocellatus]
MWTSDRHKYGYDVGRDVVKGTVTDSLISQVGKNSLMEQQDQDSACGNASSEDFYGCDVLGSGPEAEESESNWRECKYHPGHENFIPVSQFGLMNLPEEYRDQSVVDTVQAVADLTVKLVVRHSAAVKRKEFAVVCYSPRGGENSVHVGSGWVVDAKEGFGVCSGCAECTSTSFSTSTESPAESKGKWYEVYVATVVHAVYNEDEAKATEVQLFYGDKDCQREKSVKSLFGAYIKEHSTSDYSCLFVCKTHDESLVRELKGRIGRMRGMIVKGGGEEKDVLSWCEPYINTQNNLCVMVSHPHGQPKMVTLGKRKHVCDIKPGKRSIERLRLCSMKHPLYYTTDSCPGCSGAPVFMPTCVETRSIVPGGGNAAFVKAMVVRPHSFGDLYKGIGCGGGMPPLEVPRLIGLC